MAFWNNIDIKDFLRVEFSRLQGIFDIVSIDLNPILSIFVATNVYLLSIRFVKKIVT